MKVESVGGPRAMFRLCETAHSEHQGRPGGQPFTKFPVHVELQKLWTLVDTKIGSPTSSQSKQHSLILV